MGFSAQFLTKKKARGFNTKATLWETDGVGDAFKQPMPRLLGDQLFSSDGAGRKCALDIRVPKPQPSTGRLILKNTSDAGRCLGDHQPYTATTKDFGSKKGFRRGRCTNCQIRREQQNVYHPQDCTGDVHHGFCGGGARTVGFECCPF